MTAIKRYDYAFDPEGDAWAARILRRVPAGASVLELGPGPGAMTRVLVDRGHPIVVVERDAQAVQQLLALGVKVIQADLEAGEWLPPVEQLERFDVVLACDVLEHLVNPEALLRALLGVIKTNGRLIVSVPNIAYLGILAALRAGRFDYVEKGQLDRTHLRFFTRRTIESTLLVNGWIPIRWESNKVPIHHSEFACDWAGLPERLQRALLDEWTDADVYQWMVEAVPATEQGWHEALVREVAQVRDELNALRKAKHELECIHAQEHAALLEHQKAFAEAKEIIEDLSDRLAKAERQSSALRDQLAQRDRELEPAPLRRLWRRFKWRRS